MIIDDIRNRKTMSIAEALTYGYKLFKENFIQIMFIVLIIYFPLNLISGYVSINIANIEAGIDLNAVMASEDALFNFINSTQYMSFLTYNFSRVAIDMFLAPFGMMAVIALVKNYCEEKEFGWKSALETSFSLGGSFLWLRLIYCIITGVLYLLGIIPGVIVAVFWYFNIQALVIDGKKGIGALGYSRSLVSGRWLRTLFMLMVFRGLSYGLSYAVSAMFMWGAGSYFIVVLVGVILSVISTIFIAAETVMYINYQANSVDKSNIRRIGETKDNH